MISLRDDAITRNRNIMPPNDNPILLNDNFNPPNDQGHPGERGDNHLGAAFWYRGGSVCLNSFGGFAKWISTSIMPPPSLVPAG